MTRALVTAGAARLGRAMAAELAARGYDVALHCHESDPTDALAELRAAGVKAEALRADLLDPAACRALPARAAELLGGPLTVLVNNASIFDYDTLETATDESWERHIGSNLRAPFWLTQAFAAQAPRARQDAGREPEARALIVNMIDQRVRKPTPHFMTYSLAKMALWDLTQTTAQALAPHIRVNAIGPGPTLQGARQSAEHFAAQRAATILERGADAGDIRAALGYFLTAPAVTGQLLCVDGGQHLGWKTPDILGPE